jgi:aryl-alcohol dehydrogenase-like predicted oxidoreductase
VEYRNLGRTGLMVSRLIFGGAHIGELLDEAAATDLIHAAWDAGINTFYSADDYNRGAAEEILGKVIKPRRDDMVLITKVGYRIGQTGAEWLALHRRQIDHERLWRKGVGPNSRGLSRKHLVGALEGSLRRLQTDYIDVYKIHYWDYDTPIEETLQVLDDFVRQGKVRYIGCSQTAAWQLMRALWASDVKGLARFESIQLRYNLLERTAEKDSLPAAADTGVSVLVFGSLAGGILTGTADPVLKPDDRGNRQQYVDMYWTSENHERVARLRRLAEELGRDTGELAQAWTLAQPAVTSLLIGPDRAEELPSQVNAATRPLSRDEIAAVEEAIGEVQPEPAGHA